MILYLALGGAVLWLCLTVYRRNPGVQRGRWRVGAGLLASAVLAAGCLIASRGEWLPGGALVLLSLVLALGARSDRGPRPTRPTARGLSRADARSLLGVEEGAGPEAIQAAYTRLMRMAHPDRGGTTGLAAQLNAARDLLLKDDR